MFLNLLHDVIPKEYKNNQKHIIDTHAKPWAELYTHHVA